MWVRVIYLFYIYIYVYKHACPTINFEKGFRNFSMQNVPNFPVLYLCYVLYCIRETYFINFSHIERFMRSHCLVLLHYERFSGVDTEELVRTNKLITTRKKKTLNRVGT